MKSDIYQPKSTLLVFYRAKGNFELNIGEQMTTLSYMNRTRLYCIYIWIKRVDKQINENLCFIFETFKSVLCKIPPKIEDH